MSKRHEMIPGDTVRQQHLRLGETELGDVRVMWYGDDNYRVAAFLPGDQVWSRGNTPKVEPEMEQWAPNLKAAIVHFDAFLLTAQEQGWQVDLRNVNRSVK